jgi:hypothetical protein
MKPKKLSYIWEREWGSRRVHIAKRGADWLCDDGQRVWESRCGFSIIGGLFPIEGAINTPILHGRRICKLCINDMTWAFF